MILGQNIDEKRVVFLTFPSTHTIMVPPLLFIQKRRLEGKFLDYIFQSPPTDKKSTLSTLRTFFAQKIGENYDSTNHLNFCPNFRLLPNLYYQPSVEEFRWISNWSEKSKKLLE